MPGKDSLTFGNLGGGSAGGAPPGEVLLDWFKALFIILVFGYILLSVAHTLYGTPDPSGLLHLF